MDLLQEYSKIVQKNKKGCFAADVSSEPVRRITEMQCP